MDARDNAVARICERIETDVVEMRHAAPPAITSALGLRVKRIGGLVAVAATGLDILMYNRALSIGSDPPARPEELDETTAFFREAGVPRFMVQVRPGAEPEALAAWLEARGFTRHNYWLRLWRDGAPAPAVATPLPIRPIPQAEAREFGMLIAEAFGQPEPIVEWSAAFVGQPQWPLIGAYDGSRLAACAGLVVRGEAAWFGFAATRSEYRGRGLQASLIAHRIELARAQGCRHLTVETAADTPEKPNPSTRNLRRLGFRDLYPRQNWVKVLTPPA
jgi:GNAT superfamily N-acetyltransferase